MKFREKKMSLESDYRSDLTDLEIKLYGGLPLAVRSLICLHHGDYYWRPSASNLGYILSRMDGGSWDYFGPGTYSSTTSYSGNSVLGIGSSGGSVSSSSSGVYSNPSWVNSLLTNTSGYQPSPSVNSSLPTSDCIPYNQDRIIAAANSLISIFFSRKEFAPVDSSTLRSYLSMKEQYSYENYVKFSYQIIRHSPVLAEMVFDDLELELEANHYRELSIKILSEVVQHLSSYYVPSITDLSGVDNIYQKDGDKFISMESASISNDIRYSLFRLDSPREGYLLYRFIEGNFYLWNPYQNLGV